MADSSKPTKLSHLGTLPLKRERRTYSERTAVSLILASTLSSGSELMASGNFIVTAGTPIANSNVESWPRRLLLL